MESYTIKTDITSWNISEKYDGVQGIWDGRVMRTLSGTSINVPNWWKKHLPKHPLKGELWAGRGRFDSVRAVCQSENAGQKWQNIKYMVFNGINEGKNLGPYADVVKQSVVKDSRFFENFYTSVLAKGGEGVVLTSPDGLRLKHKPIKDSEGELIGFTDGQGLNSGKTGAYVLRLRDGKKFKLAAGLTAQLRACPPKIGAIIKFDYRGFTSRGLPRHASFLGIRAETSLNF